MTMPSLRKDRSMWNGNSTFRAVCAVSDVTVIIIQLHFLEYK